MQQRNAIKDKRIKGGRNCKNEDEGRRRHYSNSFFSPRNPNCTSERERETLTAPYVPRQYRLLFCRLNKNPTTPPPPPPQSFPRRPHVLHLHLHPRVTSQGSAFPSAAAAARPRRLSAPTGLIEKLVHRKKHCNSTGKLPARILGYDIKI